MKKVFYSLIVLAFVLVAASCSKDDNHNLSSAEPNYELRATSLGFADANAYKANVVEQCAADNHENCDILNNGTHQACGYAEHSGANHDGTHHNGSDHGVHDANGHSHGQNGHH